MAKNALLVRNYCESLIGRSTAHWWDCECRIRARYTYIMETFGIVFENCSVIFTRFSNRKRISGKSEKQYTELKTQLSCNHTKRIHYIFKPSFPHHISRLCSLVSVFKDMNQKSTSTSFVNPSAVISYRNSPKFDASWEKIETWLGAIGVHKYTQTRVKDLPMSHCIGRDSPRLPEKWQSHERHVPPRLIPVDVSKSGNESSVERRVEADQALPRGS